MSTLRADLTLADAAPSDLPSLATVFARIFHANNATLRTAIPDTPVTRAWWQGSFARALDDPANRVLVVRDGASVMAVLRARRIAAGDERRGGVGMLEEEQVTPDHDEALWRTLVGAIREARPRLMRGRPHYCIELFGADSNYQRCGAGGALLRRCIEIAEDEGHDIIVEANGGAVSFYVGYGFEEKEHFKVPGHDYSEHFLVYHCKKA